MKHIDKQPVPQSKKWLVDGFCRFTRRMVSKRFTAFAIQNVSSLAHSVAVDRPLIVYANHCGWWDPIVAMLVNQRYLPDRTLFAPIDADALANYRIMEKLGFYGVKLNTYQGASDFLKTTAAILESPRNAVWITPEGRFSDCRDHSQPLMPGLAHSAIKTPNVACIPFAIEYAFWDEPRPLIFTRFGERVEFAPDTSKAQCNELLTSALRATQQQLAQDVIARSFENFEYLIPPRAMRLGWYDYGRSWVAWARRRPFQPSHSRLPSLPAFGPELQDSKPAES